MISKTGCLIAIVLPLLCMSRTGLAQPPDEQSTPGEDEIPAVEEEATVTFSKNPLAIKLGDLTLTPFLQARFREEIRGKVYGNGEQAVNSAHFLTTRIRLGLGAEWKFLRILMQFQDARLFGTRPGFDDGGTFALHQGILEFWSDRGFIRIGRQEINYGNQRMIGALDWLMSARSFDALRLHGFFLDKLEVDLFGSMLARQQRFVDDTVDPPELVENNGSYLAAANLIYDNGTKLRVEGYVLYRHDRPTVTLPVPVRNDIVSPGVYVTGVPIDGLRYTGELTMQGGRQNAQRFFAFAASGDLDYTFEVTWTPTINGGFAYATGASQDGKLREFNNFFPTNHKFYGAADLFGLRNLIDGHLILGVKTPNAPVGLKLGLYTFALADPSARWSAAPGITLGQNVNNTTRTLGQEVDALFKWKFAPWASLSGGYTVFVPNHGARNLGHDIATHWGYLEIAVQTP
jgi:hypothetical protein